MSSPGFTLIRGGLLLDIQARSTRHADILIEGDTVREIGPPGMDGPADSRNSPRSIIASNSCVGVKK